MFPQHYFEKGCAPRTIHYITLECDLKAPKDQSINLLPVIWQTYCNNVSISYKIFINVYIRNRYSTLLYFLII